MSGLSSYLINEGLGASAKEEKLNENKLTLVPGVTNKIKLVYKLNEKGEQLFNSLSFNVLLPEKVQLYQLYKKFLVEVIRFYEYALTDCNCQEFCTVINNATSNTLREFMGNAYVRDLYDENMNEEKVHALLYYASIYPWNS